MFKKLIAAVAAFCIVASFSACVAKHETGGGGETETFTYLLATGESADFYLDYKDNPALQYILANKTFAGKDGEAGKIAFEFTTPPLGKEIDFINTLISTNAYLDILDCSFGTRVEDLYAAGKVLDLTDYVLNHMPNYKRFLDAHPDQAKYITSKVDGKELYLKLCNAQDSVSLDALFFGFNYRRDWIVRYGVQPDGFYDPMTGQRGENPKAGQGFAGYFSLDKNGGAIEAPVLDDTVDGDSWVDDVMFPSGHPDPVYISDWEWMFGIFQKAIDAQGISDGYVLSLYYPGYIATGDLFCAFGGGGPIWSINPATGDVEFGMASDSGKSYLECMNAWWNNGWVDKRFAERSGDVFYRIDETAYRQGKVGFFIGSAATLGARLYSEENPFTQGIVCFGAAQPINDVYGADSTKFKTPSSMFGGTDLLGSSISITDKAKEKDILRFIKFIDYLFSDEGAVLGTFGLSAEQAAQSQDPMYAKYNLKSAYTTVEEGGKTLYLRDPLLQLNDGNIRAAALLTRIPHLALLSLEKQVMTPMMENSRAQFGKYPAIGFLGGLNIDQMSMETSKEITKIQTRLEQEYLYINVPKFITGKKNLGADWDAFVADLKKRNYERGTELYNGHVHSYDGQTE